MRIIILNIVFNLISAGIAIYILKLAIECIKEDMKRYSGAKAKKSDPFESQHSKKAQINQLGLNKFTSIGAFALPFLILTIIYLLLIESFYDLTLEYIEQQGFAANVGGSLIAIAAFFFGASFARRFLKMDKTFDDLSKTNDLLLFENRVKKTEIAYLSCTFFVILFNYLDLDLRFNIIKAISTSFVSGNIYYMVFQINSFGQKTNESSLR